MDIELDIQIPSPQELRLDCTKEQVENLATDILAQLRTRGYATLNATQWSEALVERISKIFAGAGWGITLQWDEPHLNRFMRIAD